MPSVNERTRNNVRAGVFVTVSLLAIFGVVIALTEAVSILEARNAYRIRFPVTAGVEGLTVGSKVHVGGVEMGEVTGINPLIESGRFESILVDIEIDRDVTLFDDAVSLRIAPLLGNVAWINFPDIGGGEGARVVNPGDIIDASAGAGLLTTLLGPQNAARADHIVENFQTLSGFLANVGSEYEKRFVPILEKTDSALLDAGQTVAKAREDYSRWSLTIDQVMERALSISGNIDAAMAEARQIISDNHEKLNATLANAADLSADAKAIAERVRGETIDKVTSLIDRGYEGVDAFSSTGETIQQRVDAEIPGLADALANARIAAQQLKLATIEVRRSPWKLLYRPEPKELEHELLYEAARSFAVAASDLKAASGSLDRVMANYGQKLGGDEPALQQVTQNVLDSFRNYEKAQQRLFDVLLADHPE